MSAVFTIQTTINGTYYEEIKASSTVTLNTILKPSSVSAQSVNFGTESRITITSSSPSFTHTLIYSFGSTKGIIAIKTKDTSILWTPPLTLANQIPNSMAGICTITCNITLMITASMRPTISNFIAERIDGIVPSEWGIYVQSHSKAKLTIDGAVGSYGSDIVSYSISGGSFSGSDKSLTTGFLNNYGAITFKATVTDSRGRVSDEARVTIIVEQYFIPYFENYNSQRCYSSGNLTDDGTYVLTTAIYNYASCKNNNHISVISYYKKSTDTQWITAGELSSGEPVIFGEGKISTEYSYDVRYIISDEFNKISVQDIISTSAVVMDFKSGGKGVAIGKVCETENCFEVSEEWDVKVYGKLLKDYIKSLAGLMHPIGSIYMSVISTNPSEYFGGKWISWGSGRVPVGVTGADADFSPVEKTGGSKTVVLGLNNLPSHSHAKGTLAIGDGGNHSHNLNLTQSALGVSNSSNKVVVDSTTSITLSNKATASGGSHGHSIYGSTASTGGGNAHNNLQPYITCYMWKRIE